MRQVAEYRQLNIDLIAQNHSLKQQLQESQATVEQLRIRCEPGFEDELIRKR